MKVEAHDGGGVATITDAGIDPGFGSSAVVPVARVDGTFFCADEKRGWI